MPRYGVEAKERAYQLMMIENQPFSTVVRRMREDYPTFSKGTLTKWKNDAALDWNGRYARHCREVARANDTALAKQVTPMLESVQTIRENVYTQIVDFLNAPKGAKITDKNLGHVLGSFVKLTQLEHDMQGGGKNQTQVIQVVNVIIMALERNPHVGPVLKVHKNDIVDAIFEEIKDA